MRPVSSLRLLTFAAFALCPGFALHAQGSKMGTGTIAQRYQDLCANCHGKNLEGGQSPSMLDDVWTAGGDDESLAKSIRNGFPEKGMPAWGAAIPEKEVRAMVILIREMRAKHQRESTVFTKPVESMTAKSQLHSFQLNTWVGGLTEPWSLAFLPGNKAIVTEKLGYAFLVDDGKLAARPLIGLPQVDTGGQAGLYDVVPHPDHATNGWLYFAFSDLQKGGDGRDISMTRIIRGKLKGNALISQETIFQAPMEYYRPAGGPHFGGRIAFDGNGYMFFTIGERGQGPHAQELARPNGKVHRLHDDGRVPQDNPFVRDPKAARTIWSYGHRNPQGLAFHPATGELYDVEHGPRGGDEINLVQRGRNYGWPVITYGMNYDGTAMTDVTAKEGMEQPVRYWVPSIAPCGANFYTGDRFPKWKNHLFVAALGSQELHRVELSHHQAGADEVILKDLGRIRHVITGPDGALYVLLPNRIARITPAES